jgi:molybdopterin converting factor small subunit
MIIKTQIAGIFGDTPIMAKGEVELSDNSDLKTFFKKADRALGFSRPKVFRLALKMAIQPTILLNGDRLDMPEGLSQRLKDGDEVTVLTPLTGG